MNNTHHKPTQSKELQILTSLHSRMKLSPSDQQHYNNLLKGYIGERKFYHLLKKDLTLECIVLYDLLLQNNTTTFQTDSLLIHQDQLLHFEIKNFQGDFYIEGNKWYAASTNKEINNPLLQLQRSNYLLRNLLQQLGYNFSIVSYVVFINDSFTLYNAPLNLPAIFPTQTSRFISKLNSESAVTTEYHQKLANQLIDRHITDHPFERLPNYDFDRLKKGIICTTCSGFLSSYNDKILICNRCKTKNGITPAILRSVREFNLLFPDKKITTPAIHEWCDIIASKKTVRRILSAHLQLVQKGRFSYFVTK